MNESALVLISGGSRGLGLAITKHLLKDGYQVATFSRSVAGDFERLREEYRDRLFYFPGDLADSAAMEGLVKSVEKDVGPIDVLINNAGIAVDGVLATMPPEQIERLIAVNLTGTMLLTRLVVRRMIVRCRGNVLTISSIIGLRGYAGLAAYSATKAGLDGMTRALARELGPRKIRVNAIAPGYLATEMTDKLDDKQRSQIIRRTPLNRLGLPEDVVGVVSFLLSPASAFMTGQTIVVDGGITC
jgi:3-oxoacyl-[acyl-carrier protein] reductase